MIHYKYSTFSSTISKEDCQLYTDMEEKDWK